MKKTAQNKLFTSLNITAMASVKGGDYDYGIGDEEKDGFGRVKTGRVKTG